MAKRESNTNTLEEAIQRLLKAYRLDGKMLEIDVVDAWEKVMGPLIKSKTNEAWVKDRVLHVRLESSTLREELSYGKPQIIKNINDHIGQEFLNDVVLK